MNVVVVPFFLAANLAVNDMSNWQFGPEYSYNMSIIYDIRQTVSTAETIIGASFNSTVHCRPKEPEMLVCHLSNISGMANIMGYKTTEDIDSEKVFGIKFNERGVESLLIEPCDTRILNIIRQVANQFSMNVNLMRKNNVQPIPQFMDKENTSMGNCLTTYAITHAEHQPSTNQKKDINFELKVLPISTMRPGINLSISKNRKACVNGPERVDIFAEGIFRAERFSSTIWIDNTYKTFTEINGNLIPVKNPSSNKFFLFTETIELNLDTIEPARDKLPSLNSESFDVIDLNTKVVPK
ncbi:uncharacterized protein LOC105285598 [Ooceraea biroi]|uniref:uncharacterized protein LOC105285598 n=1 Tax=Ooceraea biroi TaxID=2015173 RepID=UPI0005B8B953|nr:uncharacterized protein LOC105285598 [Ooceraea biroi]